VVVPTAGALVVLVASDSGRGRQALRAVGRTAIVIDTVRSSSKRWLLCAADHAPPVADSQGWLEVKSPTLRNFIAETAGV
jgi:hypothetical protein